MIVRKKTKGKWLIYGFVFLVHLMNLLSKDIVSFNKQICPPFSPQNVGSEYESLFLFSATS